MFANEIRDRLASYLANEIPVEEFEDWVAQNTWNIHRAGDQNAERLAYAIEAKLAEFSGSHIEESSLRAELAPLATHYIPELAVEWASIIPEQESPNLTTRAEIPMAVS